MAKVDHPRRCTWCNPIQHAQQRPREVSDLGLNITPELQMQAQHNLDATRHCSQRTSAVPYSHRTADMSRQVQSIPRGSPHLCRLATTSDFLLEWIGPRSTTLARYALPCHWCYGRQRRRLPRRSQELGNAKAG